MYLYSISHISKKDKKLIFTFTVLCKTKEEAKKRIKKYKERDIELGINDDESEYIIKQHMIPADFHC